MITTVEGALRAVLMNDSAVMSLVGSRIYVFALPDTCTFPAISIHNISDPYSRVKGSPRIQVSAWDFDPLTVKNIKTAIEAALDGYSGTQGNIQIVQITPLESNDISADAAGLCQIAYDFQVLHKK